VGPHTIDRFASMLNAQLPGFNARWRDPKCEDVDCLHLPDATWQRENNYCNPPWLALPALAAKMFQSQAAATVTAPYRPNKTWYHALARLADTTLHFHAARDLFFPGWLGKHEGVGPPAWSIVAFRLSPPSGCSPDAERLAGRYARTD
jgi:hypothetical protein